MLGRPGHLRLKAQTGIQERIDRMSMDRTTVLPVDHQLSKLFTKNNVEKILQTKPVIKTTEEIQEVTRELNRFSPSLAGSNF